jgi:(p)ppGpp synthase/HD superfamily hydrolase
MQAGKTEDEQICGVLHDLVEDSDWTFENLKKEGFPDHIIDALKCLTKQANEIYDHFIDRVMTNTLAVQVKINDLTDNMDIKRLTSIGEKDVERLNTYLKAYRKLKS